MKINLKGPQTVVKQKEVSAQVSSVEVNRLVVNFRQKRVVAITDGGRPIVVVQGKDFEAIQSGGSLNLNDVANKVVSSLGIDAGQVTAIEALTARSPAVKATP